MLKLSLCVGLFGGDVARFPRVAGQGGAGLVQGGQLRASLAVRPEHGIAVIQGG
jgi:hypothetical protein